MPLKAKPTLDIEALAETHYDAVWQFCYRRVGTSHAADATQDTFLTALRRKDTFRGDAEPRIWLFGIAHNVCRNLRRAHKPETPLADHAEPSDMVDTLHTRGTLVTALERLSPEHREVVVLHELDSLTYGEIAAVLGVPAGTVKSRLHHAFLNLRKILGPMEALK